MCSKELQEFLEKDENNIKIAIDAIDKLLRNLIETKDDETTLCSSTCSKRSVYEIYASMKLIELVKYDEENNAKYFKVVNKEALLDIKERINSRYN